MTKAEFDLINSLASQLQHFVDGDGKQATETSLHQLLDLAEATLHLARGQFIRERDFGGETGRN